MVTECRLALSFFPVGKDVLGERKWRATRESVCLMYAVKSSPRLLGTAAVEMKDEAGGAT